MKQKAQGSFSDAPVSTELCLFSKPHVSDSASLPTITLGLLPRPYSASEMKEHPEMPQKYIIDLMKHTLTHIYTMHTHSHMHVNVYEYIHLSI